MFHELVERAHRVADSLAITSPSMHVGSNFDVATYLTFLNELLQRLEDAAAEFESVIYEASRNLLAVAVEGIFSNLRRLQPDLDLETVTVRVEDEQTLPLSRAVASAVNTYSDRFKRSAAEEDASEEGSDEEDEDAGDGASA